MLHKNRILPLLSLLLIVGFLATSLSSFFVSRASVRKQISQNELPLTSDTIYSEIQRDLLRPIFIASLMASDTFLRDWVLQGESHPQKVVKYLNEIKTRYRAFTSFFVSEATQIYYHADGVLKTVSQEEPRDRWYYRVKQMKADYEINADPDLANNDAMTIFINYKVFDYDGSFLGATGVGLPVKTVKRLIEEYQAKYQRVVYFVDPAGEVVLHGSSFQYGGQRLDQMPGLTELASTVLAEPNGTYRYDRDGRTVHLNSRYIPEFGWYLLVEQEEQRALKNIRRTLFLNLAICAFMTAIVLSITKLALSGYQRRLEKMAVTDRLTGLPNRHSYDHLFGKYLLEVERSGEPLSVILFDINHFKQINDNFGHLAGDAALRHVARITEEVTRSADLICRWGGDEFLIILKGCSLTDAEGRAEMIQSAIEDNPFIYKGSRLSLSISKGVAENQQGDTADDLLARADAALYREKKASM